MSMCSQEQTPESEAMPTVQTMTNDELARARDDISERLRHMLTPKGRRELEQRLKEVTDQMRANDYAAEVARGFRP